MMTFIDVTTGYFRIEEMNPTYIDYYGIVNSVTKCIYLCSLSDGLANQAKAAGRAIYKMDVYAIKILSEIELVSLQVISHQNRITAAELFNIDKRLLFAMVQAITAYYIILVQLYPNQNK
ncbi:unnamed protein product [Acanthoscelides obtectus]|nr:unnamed protein product [Acanthoscelides obtectus]CAK1629111.1 hypothetical protein AOBTE_LOCUS5585 [Acanthoscelides obtectus]